MMAQSAAPTRLPRQWLWQARLIWFLILGLALWKLILGTPLIYAEKITVCTGTAQECVEGISPTAEDDEAIQAAGLSIGQYARLAMVFRLFEVVVWFGTGLLIFSLRSDDWMALAVSAMMILFTSGQASDPISRAYPNLDWLAQLGFSLQNALLFLFIGLFPNGRFAPRWMKWYWIAMIALALLSDFILQSLIPWAEWLWLPGWLSFLILGPYSQIYRYRKTSNPVERIQTRWEVFGFGAMAGLILIGAILQIVGLVPDFVMQDFFFGLASLAIPVSVGISVLRYRLWDIDVIIRRTLVYGALTATLGLVFFGSVVLLQSLVTAVGGQQSAVVTVVSTLLIAALFTPLRRRIQNDIDRRFFRKKYDAEVIMAAFGSSLREKVNLEDLQTQITAVVEETLQPEHLSLWLRPVRRLGAEQGQQRSVGGQPSAVISALSVAEDTFANRHI